MARKKRPAKAKATSRTSRRALADRPTPVEAIAMRNADLEQRLAARGDRYSELLSRVVRDEPVGSDLLLAEVVVAIEQHTEISFSGAGTSLQEPDHEHDGDLALASA
jgi:hypothetical protein